MLNFIANSFRGFFVFCLWINLIIYTIGGGIIGNILFSGHPILGGIIGFLTGLMSNIIYGGVTVIFLRIDSNLQILVKTSGGQPIENGIDISKEKPSILSKPVSFETDTVPYGVIKEIPLNDSLSVNPKTIRILKRGEKVAVNNILERNNLGRNSGIWALVKTQHNDEGWCLFEALSNDK
jgi:hypothetical protein